MANPRLSIIIVNYNVKEFLEQSLQAIQKASLHLTVEVIVVDNHSVDGSQEMVRTKFPWVRLIANPDNRGFAVANNQGISSSSGDYVLLLNPDTLVQEDTFTVLVEYLDAHPEIGLAGCKILNPDGTLQLACRRSFPTLKTALPKILGLSSLFPHNRLFARYNLTYLDPDEITDVDAVSGSFMFARREAIDQVGMLDESFFMYGEDLDWCYRFKQQGWGVQYVPLTKIIHYKGESSKLAPFDSYITFYRAMNLFVKKHFSRRWLFVFDLFIRLGILIRGTVGFLGALLKQFAPQILDSLIILTGFLVAILIKFGSLDYVIDYSFLPLIYAGIWIGALNFTGSYRLREYSISKAMSGLVLGFVVISALTLFFNQFAYSRAVLLMAFLYNGFLLTGWRVFYRSRHGTPLGKPVRKRRALIVGAGKEGQRILKRLTNQLSHGYEIVGFVNEGHEQRINESILGSGSELPELVRVHRITDVIFTSDVYRNTEILSMVDQLKDHQVELKIVPQSLEFILGKATVEDITEIPLVDLNFPLSRRGHQITKRLVDFLIALLLIPFVVPVCFSVAALKKWTLTGRTIPDESGESFEYKRFTVNGIPARGCGLSPALFAVLRGKMSLVGIPLNTGTEPPVRRLFKPGITSLWEVESGDSGEIDTYNQFYMQHHSLGFDIQILLRYLFGSKNTPERFQL